MGKVNFSNQLVGSGNTDVAVFNGGVSPGIASDDVLGRTPTVFSVQSLGSTVYSAMTQSFLANTSSIGQVSPVLGKLIEELIRKKVIDGDFSV